MVLGPCGSTFVLRDVGSMLGLCPSLGKRERTSERPKATKRRICKEAKKLEVVVIRSEVHAELSKQL